MLNHWTLFCIEICCIILHEGIPVYFNTSILYIHSTVCFFYSISHFKYIPKIICCPMLDTNLLLSASIQHNFLTSFNLNRKSRYGEYKSESRFISILDCTFTFLFGFHHSHTNRISKGQLIHHIRGQNLQALNYECELDVIYH